jgi:hypothetical protein
MRIVRSPSTTKSLKLLHIRKPASEMVEMSMEVRGNFYGRRDIMTDSEDENEDNQMEIDDDDDIESDVETKTDWKTMAELHHLPSNVIAFSH